MRLLKPAQRRARAQASHAYPLPHSYVAGGTKDAYPYFQLVTRFSVAFPQLRGILAQFGRYIRTLAAI